jgi:hypothetical protein
MELTHALPLALAPDSSLVIEVSAAQLRQLRNAFAAVVDAAEKAVSTLAEVAGPQPHPIAQALRTRTLMGAGYFRESRDTLNALFKARGQAHRAKRKKGAR